MKKSDLFFGLLRLPVDIAMTLLAFFVAYRLRSFTKLIPGIELERGILPNVTDYFHFATTAAIVLIIIFGINEMYSLRSTSPLTREMKKNIKLGSAWFMLIIAYFFAIHSLPFSRLIMGYSWILTIIFCMTGRTVIRIIQYILLKKGIGQRKIAVIGESRFAKEITKELEKNPHYKIVGFMTENGSSHNELFLGTIENFETIIRKNHIEEVIQAQSNMNKMKDAQIVNLCRSLHVGYSFVPDLLEMERSNIDVTAIGKIPLISLKPTPLEGWGKIWKRCIDIIGSLIGLILSAPIILIAGIAIKLDSKGPIFFTKLDNGDDVKRVGQHGKLFKFYKLRTMVDKSHQKRYEMKEENIRKGSPLVKIKDDPRITKVGKFLRRSSIDEIPNFWNVLKGDMSLVGPRPHFPEEIEKYEKSQHFVLEVKPGITGLSQINGRSNLEFEKEIKYDTYYIRNWTALLDLKIIIKTLGVIVKGYQE